MPALPSQENLQPSLLDRLTDDEPGKLQESRHERVLSPTQLRESVRRDLGWLLNTTNLASMQPDIERYPGVARSTVNYGLPDLAGKTASSVEPTVLARMLREAIVTFEPRLIRESVRVTPSARSDEMSLNAMTFSIEAMLWAQPLPLRLFFRTAVDLDSGKVDIAEWSESPGKT
jgi:type VI secretion system protein ImpF